MRNCWLEDPLARPTFSDLVEQLGNYIEDHVKHVSPRNSRILQKWGLEGQNRHPWFPVCVYSKVDHVMCHTAVV